MLSLVLSLSVSAQVLEFDDNFKLCNADWITEEFLKLPEIKSAHNKRQAKLANLHKNTGTSINRMACANPVVLPVAVHYQNISSPNSGCLESLAMEAIQRLNKDFQGSNFDISSWNNSTGFYPGLSNGEACLEFCLATQNHPQGSNLQNGEHAITINTTTGDYIPAWSGYINIVVRNLTEANVLGYSPVGGYGLGDALVIDNNAFGTFACSGVVQSSNSNLNRTLTHEMGHYLYLRHIWGDGDCSVDDGITDTPSADGPNYWCPSLGVNSCGSNDLWMNYMDYTDDNCMYMFSQGQIDLMEAFVNISLQNVVNNGATVCGGGSPALMVNSKIFLQGCYDQNSQLMGDKLRTLGYIPIQEPYSNNPDFTHSGNEQTTSSVLSQSGSNAIVDWILVELRASNNSSAIVQSRAALLQRDGDIVDVDGSSPVLFDVDPNSAYYLAIRHRNHLGIMSKYSLIGNSSSVLTIDFTNPFQSIYGQYGGLYIGNKQVLWAGNGNIDGAVIFQGGSNDPNEVFYDILTSPFNPNSLINHIDHGYFSTDYNLDGDVIYQGNGNELNVLFFNVLIHPGNTFSVPNYIIYEQLP